MASRSELSIHHIIALLLRSVLNHDTIKLTKRSSPLSRKKWPKRGSSLCQNNLAGRRVDGNLIEQNDIFVQLREGRAREGGLF